MNLKHAHSIFDGISQILDHDTDEVRPIGDRVLIRDLGPVEHSAIIAAPDTTKDKAQLRYGLVLACGIGDRFTEHGLDGNGNVRRRVITRPCKMCVTGQFFDARQYRRIPCPACKGEQRIPLVVAPQCKVGDRVIWNIRREAHFQMRGENVYLIHAEQSVWAVVED